MKNALVASASGWLEKYIGKTGVKILLAIVFFVIGYLIITAVMKGLRKWIVRTKIDPVLHVFILSVIRIALIVLLALTCVDMIGIKVTALITALGAAGLAVGLSLQDSLKNLAGGIFMMLSKPFSVGDWVEVGAEQGKVESIGLTHTTINSLDNKRIMIPNGDISGARIINHSANPTRMVKVEFGVDYRSDLDKVKAVILEVAQKHPMVLIEPKPLIRCSEYTENALMITCRVWCRTENYWDLYFDLIEQVKEAFDENGITIPYPQLDVHLTPEK